MQVPPLPSSSHADVEHLSWPDRFNAEATHEQQFCELFHFLGETLDAVAGPAAASDAMTALISRLWRDGMPSLSSGEQQATLAAGNWRDVVRYPEFYESTLREECVPSYNDFLELYSYAIEGVINTMLDVQLDLDGRRGQVSGLMLRTKLMLRHLPKGWQSSASVDAWPLERLHAAAAARWKLDQGEPLGVEEIALLGRVDERSVQNAMSARALHRDDDGRCAAADVERWLLAARPKKFRRSRWLDLSDDLTGWEAAAPAASGDTVHLPVDADGKPFSPSFGRRTRGGSIGWRIGPKGGEVVCHDFYQALDTLRTMHPPRWRRPNPAGNWGIVRGEPQWKGYPRADIEAQLRALPR